MKTPAWFPARAFGPWAWCALALALLLAGQPARAQFAKPEQAVEYRQAAYTLIGSHMKRIKSQLDVSKPDLAAVRASTALIDMLKTLPFEAFIPGSGDVADSRAKPEIWTDREHFDRLAREMQDKVARLDAAARAGDVPALRTAFGETGRACKNCHEDFRKKD